MYDQIIPPMTRTLGALSNILTKAQSFAEAKSVKPEVLPSFRLAPDMLPMSKQVQLSCDFACRAAARLAGVEVPSFPDVEVTLPELQARIKTALAYLAGFTPAQFEGAAARQITFPTGGQEMTLSGMNYLCVYALPQFYFHVTTAYNILRHNGVEIGKRDYMGA